MIFSYEHTAMEESYQHFTPTATEQCALTFTLTHARTWECAMTEAMRGSSVMRLISPKVCPSRSVASLTVSLSRGPVDSGSRPLASRRRAMRDCGAERCESMGRGVRRGARGEG